MRSRGGGGGWELLHRRYSVPEIVMRKYSLSRQQTSSAGSSTTSESGGPNCGPEGSGSGTGTGSGASAPGSRPRWRHSRRHRANVVNKSSQTSPAKQPPNHCQLLVIQSPSREDTALLERSSHTASTSSARRSKSYPEELSSREGKVYKSFRPISADEKLFSLYTSSGSSGGEGSGDTALETPSPRLSGCRHYEVRHTECSQCNRWTTSASTTLSQTATERTTSTQDSTLSIPSTTPESYPLTPGSQLDFRPDPSIFSPALGTVVIDSETTLVYPIEIEESGKNYRFAFSGSSDSQRESPTKDESDSSETHMEETESTRTTVARLETLRPSPSLDDSPDVLSVISCTYRATGTDATTNTEIVFGEPVSPIHSFTSRDNDHENPTESEFVRAVACQTSVGPSPPTTEPLNDKVYVNSQPDLYSNLRERQEALEREFFGQEEANDEPRFSFMCRKNVYTERSEHCPIDYIKTNRGLAEVSGTSGNYKEFPGSEMVIPRYSAIPRSGSMLVNTSSVDYTSDSDLSLTDSLEDPSEHIGHNYWPSSKHDNRLVRGEVNTHEEMNTRKKYIKSKNTYAYFLFLSGEEDMIKEYTLPEKIKTRLRQREEEIKKHFEMKFSLAKKPFYRKRKKLNFVRRNSDTNSSNPQDKKKQCSNLTNKSTQCSNKSQSSSDHKNSPVHRRNIIKKINVNKSNLKDCKIKERKGESEIDKDIAQILMMSVDLDDRDVDVNPEQEDNSLKTKKGNSVQTEISDEKGVELIHCESPNKEELTEGISVDEINSIGTQTEIMERTKQKEEIVNNNAMMQVNEPIEGTSEQLAKNSESVSDETEVLNHSDHEEAICDPVKQLSVMAQTDTTTTAERKEDGDNLQIRNGVERTEKCSSPLSSYVSTSVQTQSSNSEDKATSVNGSNCDDNLNKAVQVSGTTDLNEMKNMGDSSLSSCSSSPPAIVPEIIIEDALSSPNDNSDESSDVENSPVESDAVGENDKNAINSIVGTAMYLSPTKQSQRETPKSSGKASNRYRSKPEILEINTTSCTCHMCTFQKMSASPTGLRESSGKSLPDTSRPIPTRGRLTASTHGGYSFRQEKKISKPSIGRRNLNMAGRFTQKFEVIPEERNSSLESPTEEQNTPLDLSPHWKRTAVNFPEETMATPETEVGLDHRAEAERLRKLDKKTAEETPVIEKKNCDIISFGKPLLTKSSVGNEKEGPNVVNSNLTEENSHIPGNKRQTKNSKVNPSSNQSKQGQSHPSNKRSSVVIGRFKAVQEDKTEKNDCFLGESLNIVRQYKGRAALASTQLEQDDQEELLTLSRGWINFYLLRDNQDVASDNSNSEEFLQKPDDKIRQNQKGKPISGQQEELVQQYTLEIQATPESNTTNYSQNKEITLPNLKTKGNKKQDRPVIYERPDLILPDITSSSSSSTPESILQHSSTPPLKSFAPSTSKLPELKKEKKNGLRGKQQKKEKTNRRSPSPEASINSHSLNIPMAIESTRAVDVVCSEHSMSSVTSSTVILSDSPPPEKIKLPERKVQRHRTHNISSTSTTKQTTCINNSGNSWTVTVAGSSSNADQPPPDVEMRLMFGRNERQSKREKSDGNIQNKELVHYDHTHHTSRNVTGRPSRQQESNLEEQVDSSRNTHRTLRCLPEAPFITSQQGKRDKGYRTRSEHSKESPLQNVSLNDCMHHSHSRGFCRMCSRDNRDSGSENTLSSICSNLQVTGMSITPEQKPRVPTQSERDLVRSHKYKFT